MKTGFHPLVTALLSPPSWVYGKVVGLRNRRYDRKGGESGEIPVLSVGNLTVGGTGKTPTVAWLVRRLLTMGRRPAVVSRGYGGSAGKGPLVVSRGEGPLCDASRCGDEPYLLARSLPGAVVVVGSDRRAGAAEAHRLDADVVVLDDGFQHRRLARDLDIVLLDAAEPFGGERLLPAGRLREPLQSLGRADVVAITRSGGPGSSPEIEAAVRRHNRDAPILYSAHRPAGFFSAADLPIDPPRRAVGFCGIGAPDEFRRDLEAAGVELAAFVPFRDHHPFSAEDLRGIRETCERSDAVALTTEKDLARLGEAQDLPGLSFMRIEIDWFDPAPLVAAVDEVFRSVAEAPE